MPAKDQTKTPQAEIEKAVKRYFARELPAAALAKEYGVSKAAFYLWVKKFKAESAATRLSNLPGSEGERYDALIAENQKLKEENRKLRDKVIELMLKHNGSNAGHFIFTANIPDRIAPTGSAPELSLLTTGFG